MINSAQERKNNVLASNLLFSFWAFSLMTEIVRTKVLHIARMSPVFAIVSIYAAYFGLYYAIRLGKQWAKVALAVAFVLTIMVGVSKEMAGYSLLEAVQLRDYLYLVNFALSYIIPAWALVLIVKKSRPQAVP